MAQIPSNKTPAEAYKLIWPYIIDDYDRKFEASELSKRHFYTPHETSCKAFRVMFKQAFDVEARSVTLPKNTREKGFFEFFRDERAKKGKNDLMVIYFHGDSGGKGENYIWRFVNSYPRKVHARRLFRLFSESEGPDVLFVIDAWIEERENKRIVRRTGVTEIIARPEPGHLVSGKINTAESFTASLACNLFHLYDRARDNNINGLTNRTLFQHLAHDRTATKENRLSGNPKRIHMSNAKKQRVEPTRKIKVLNDESNEAGQLVLGLDPFKDFDPKSQVALKMANKAVVFDAPLDDGEDEGYDTEEEDTMFVS